MSRANTVSNLQAMIELARAQNVEVVLIAVPEFGIMLSTANFYSELATQHKIPVEDKVLSKILRQPALRSDQIHPNSAGYALLAEAMVNLLAATGAIKSEK
jgi:lysophospholipase L1-like esterase